MVRENQLFVDLTDLRALLSSSHLLHACFLAGDISLQIRGTHDLGTLGRHCETWGKVGALKEWLVGLILDIQSNHSPT